MIFQRYKTSGHFQNYCKCFLTYTLKLFPCIDWHKKKDSACLKFKFLWFFFLTRIYKYNDFWSAFLHPKLLPSWILDGVYMYVLLCACMCEYAHVCLSIYFRVFFMNNHDIHKHNLICSLLISRPISSVSVLYCVCVMLWWFEWKWPPRRSGTLRDYGLVGVDGALLEEVWPYWRTYVIGGGLWSFRHSSQAQCLTLFSSWLWI